MKKISILMLVVIMAAILFRLSALGWGLPSRYSNDETSYIETSLRMGAGKFEPEQLVHGTLFPEILFLVYGVYFLAGLAGGIFTSPDSFMLAYLEGAAAFTILARLVVIAFSIGSLYLTYRIGKKLFSKTTGIVACFLLSFSTVHYMMSVIALADMVAVFFMLLSFYFLSQYYTSTDDARYGKSFYIAAFIAGLAMAAKLLVFPVIICLIAACVFRERKLSPALLKRMFLGLFLAFLGFFIAEPYPLFNAGKFLLLFDRLEINYMNPVKTVSPFFLYIFRWLPDSIGVPASISFLAGAIYFGITRRLKGIVLVIIFPLVHFTIFQVLKATSFAYHLLPVLPFALLVTGAVFDSITLKLKKLRPIALIALSIICVFNPAMDSFRYRAVIASTDTRKLAGAWIEENVRSDTSIILEGALGNDLVLVPKLNENKISLEDSRARVIAHGGTGKFQTLLMDSPNYKNKKRYHLYKVSQHFKESDVLNSVADYLVTSGFFDLDAGELDGSRGAGYYNERENVRKAIDERFILVKKFVPYPEFKIFYPLFFTDDYNTLRSISLLKDLERVNPGPEIGIYKRISGSKK